MESISSLHISNTGNLGAEIHWGDTSDHLVHSVISNFNWIYLIDGRKCTNNIKVTLREYEKTSFY